MGRVACIVVMYDPDAARVIGEQIGSFRQIIQSVIGGRVSSVPLGELFSVKGESVDPHLITNEFKSSPEEVLTLMVTGYDLVPEGMRFVYGFTGQYASVVSTRRLGGMSDARRLVAVSLHELLHQKGFVQPEWPQYLHDPVFPGHCRTSSCLMHPIRGDADLARVEAGLLARASDKTLLCADCCRRL